MPCIGDGLPALGGARKKACNATGFGFVNVQRRGSKFRIHLPISLNVYIATLASLHQNTSYFFPSRNRPQQFDQIMSMFFRSRLLLFSRGQLSIKVIIRYAYTESLRKYIREIYRDYFKTV